MKERPTNEALKLKVQSLIDRILYLNDTEYQEFIDKYDRLVEKYKPHQIEVDGVKYFRAMC